MHEATALGVFALLVGLPTTAVSSPPATGDPTAASFPAGFVDLREVAPGVVADLRYATADNFVGRRVVGYEAARCLLTRPAAVALARAESALERLGFRLLVYDCYRPRRAVEDFARWARTPPADARTPAHNPVVPKGDLFDRGYIAARSGHSRGSTVDLTLVPFNAPVVANPQRHRPWQPSGSAPDCRTIRGALAPDGTLNMGTTFDCLDEQAHADAEVPSVARRNRSILRRALETEGFVGYRKEWWHFTLSGEPFPDTYFDFAIPPRP